MAMTGAILGDKCYGTQAEALDAYYTGSPPNVTAGSTSYLVEFVKTAGVWQQQSYSISGTGVWTLMSTTNAPAFTFPACDPSEPFFDGMAIGWGIAAAMVAVSALMMMRRGARGG